MQQQQHYPYHHHPTFYNPYPQQQQRRKVAIFWDYSTCPIASEFLQNFVTRLVHEQKQTVCLIRLFADMETLLPKDRNALFQTGVEMRHIPASVLLSSILIVDVMNQINDDQHAEVILGTGDANLVPLAQSLTQRQVPITVLVPKHALAPFSWLKTVQVIATTTSPPNSTQTTPNSKQQGKQQDNITPAYASIVSLKKMNVDLSHWSNQDLQAIVQFMQQEKKIEIGGLSSYLITHQLKQKTSGLKQFLLQNGQYFDIEHDEYANHSFVKLKNNISQVARKKPSIATVPPVHIPIPEQQPIVMQPIVDSTTTTTSSRPPSRQVTPPPSSTQTSPTLPSTPKSSQQVVVIPSQQQQPISTPTTTTTIPLAVSTPTSSVGDTTTSSTQQALQALAAKDAPLIVQLLNQQKNKPMQIGALSGMLSKLGYKTSKFRQFLDQYPDLFQLEMLGKNALFVSNKMVT